MNDRMVALALCSSIALLGCSSPQEKEQKPPTEETTKTVGEKPEPTPETEVEVVAESPHQWTGIAVVESGRIYVNFPRWSPDIPMSVGYLKDGEVVPFPDESWNSWKDGELDFEEKFVSVQSVVSDGEFVWVLDTGNPGFGGVIPGAARLFKFDGEGNKLEEYGFSGVAQPATYLNDVRFHGEYAIITDSGIGGLIVLNMESGDARHILTTHPSTRATDTTVVIDGEPWLRNGEPPKIHADGIAIHDGTVYYQALSARTLYEISVSMLAEDVEPEARAAAVKRVAEVGPSDGLLAGPDGTIYLSSLELNAVRALRPNGEIDVVAQDPLIAWPDSFSMGPDGALYLTTSRIHQSPNPPKPYGVLKLPID